MTIFNVLNDHVNRYLRERQQDDTPDTRIEILHKLKKEIEKDESLPFIDRFKTIQAIDSEVAVQRVRKYVTQLDLF